MNDKEAIRAFVLLFLLYAFASTLDFIYLTEVVPCDTDYECEQLNPHLGGYEP